jgi:uncharacterized protein (TIGR02246 family)
MRRIARALASCGGLALAVGLVTIPGGAQEPKDKPAAVPPANQVETITTSTTISVPGGAAPAADEAAVRAVSEAFTKAYNADDAKAIAALFDADGEVVLEDGKAVRGRDAIERHFAATFAASPGSQVEVQTDSIKFLGPDVAKEEGSATVTLPSSGGRKETGRYTVLYLRRDGRWLQSSVRVYPPDELSPRERLKDLAWMVGDWVDEDAGSVNVSSCRWVEGDNFLERTFTLQVKGRPVMTGTMRIGWDPLTKQIKSWVFDSSGGQGEGYWSREGDRWIVKAVGVHADGRRATATQVITVVNKDMAKWQSVDRTLGDEVLPDLDEYALARKPPKPN